jgi:hypothetical protein
MGDLMSAIQDDINVYKDLCERLGENVRYKLDAYGHKIVDCYGRHAQKIIKKARKFGYDSIYPHKQ